MRQHTNANKFQILLFLMLRVLKNRKPKNRSKGFKPENTNDVREVLFHWFNEPQITTVVKSEKQHLKCPQV